MKDLLKHVLLLLFLTVSSAFAGQNQLMASKSYLCHFRKGEIRIDGRLDDKAWLNVPWSDNFVDIATANAAPANRVTRFKMLWDSTYCYIAACLVEHDIWAELLHRDDTVYHDNDFEVFIDPDGDGKNYFELEVNALGTVMDLFLPKPYNQGGKAQMKWDAKGLQLAVARYGTINHPGDTDTRWTVEMAIPWKALKGQKPPADGSSWRFNFSRVEWAADIQNGKYKKRRNPVNGKFLPEENWVWSPQGVVNMHIPSRWGTVRFVRDPAPQIVPKLWVWTQAHKKWKDNRWFETLKKLSQAGIRGLLLSADTATLHKMALMAQCFNIQVHAWYVTMNNRNAPAQWLSVNALGQSLAQHKAYVNYYKFMCPGLPAVRSFLLNKMKELSSVRGLAGIHFDYIRYVDVILPKKLQPKYHLKQKEIMPQFDYGYHPYMRKRFSEKYGIDPLNLSDPLHDTTWLHFRLKVLDTTVIRLRNEIKKAGLKTSAAVFPTPDMSRRMVRQDWDRWQLDYYFSMAYHNFYGKKYAWLQRVSATDKRAVGKHSMVFTGLFLPALKKRHQLTRAMKASLTGGADGIALFNLRALDAHLLQQVAAFAHRQGWQ